MKLRALLTLTAIVSALLGALALYLVLSVPNDLRADALLKQARQEMNDGQNGNARTALLQIVQQYPRTDAAAAANVALVSMAEKERADLARQLTAVRKQNEQQAKSIAELQKQVLEIQQAAAKAAMIGPPAPPPAPAPKVSARKPPAKKAPTRRRRR